MSQLAEVAGRPVALPGSDSPRPFRGRADAPSHARGTPGREPSGVRPVDRFGHPARTTGAHGPLHDGRRGANPAFLTQMMAHQSAREDDEPGASHLASAAYRTGLAARVSFSGLLRPTDLLV